MDFNDLHPRKAPLPILTTELGITMDFNLMHLLKASFSISRTPGGITYFLVIIGKKGDD